MTTVNASQPQTRTFVCENGEGSNLLNAEIEGRVPVQNTSSPFDGPQIETAGLARRPVELQPREMEAPEPAQAIEQHRVDVSAYALSSQLTEMSSAELAELARNQPEVYQRALERLAPSEREGIAARVARHEQQEAFIDQTPEELVAAMHEDPEAFWKMMGELGPEDRTFVFQKTQQRLQQINQMFTMMSNFAKSSHDTQKAILNNFRV